MKEINQLNSVFYQQLFLKGGRKSLRGPALHTSVYQLVKLQSVSTVQSNEAQGVWTATTIYFLGPSGTTWSDN